MNAIERYKQLLFGESRVDVVPDEIFVSEFAKHFETKGSRALSVEEWALTMRRALGLNLGTTSEETVYNEFDVTKVRRAFASVPGITITPAREFAPVAFVRGSVPALQAVASLSPLMKTNEISFEDDGSLRLAWD